MTRSAVAWIAAFVLSLAVQGSLIPLIAIAGITPDLPLIALFFFAVQTGSLPGIIAGFIVGLCQDLYGASLLGQHALAGTLCGWFAGLFNDRVMRIDPIYKGVLLAAVFVLHGAILAAALIVKSGAPPATLLTDTLFQSLPRALYSLALVGVFYIWDMFLKPSQRR